MATYYRWRKSEAVASEVPAYAATGAQFSVTKEITILVKNTKPNIIVGTSGMGSGEVFVYDWSSFDNSYIVSAGSGGSSIEEINLTGKYVKLKGGSFANYDWSRSIYKAESIKYNAGSNTIFIKYQEGSGLEVTASPGNFVEFVYSLNSGSYSANGQKGEYYYDQRTTVTSPTAPAGITTPAPGESITTSKVTVSWGAATSNVPDYPVNLYELSYAMGYENSWTVVGTTASTSMEVNIPAGTMSIRFRVRARDSNNQWGSYYTNEVTNPVYLAPTLTVPQQLMQGQQATINWGAIEGASSYTLQRKSSADADWTQVYSGANLTFSEAVGIWTTVQYRVQAVFDGTPGGWAESAAIPVVSASSLVISGTDEDLGVVTNDIPYSISTDTGNQITATITVNNAVIFSGNVGNSTADVIPVLDLITGEGTIVISATVEASGGPVTATRTWTYEKAAITFPNSGSVAQVTKEGENIYPKVLAEGVRLPGGKTLDQVMGFPCQIYTGTKYGINNNTELEFPFNPKALLVFSGVTLALFIRGSNTGYCSVSSNGYEDSTLEWKENSIRFVDSPFTANQTYTYVCFG